MWGPAGMSAELTAKINADVRKALADPGVLEKLRNTGNTPLDMSAPEFAKFVRSEIEDYQRVVRTAGIKPQ
jgi:tripartite-type tricarboxylate transporter receptor subunit TctC